MTRMRTTRQRRAAYRHGHVAEGAAMILLLAKGIGFLRAATGRRSARSTSS